MNSMKNDLERQEITLDKDFDNICKVRCRIARKHTPVVMLVKNKKNTASKHTQIIEEKMTKIVELLEEMNKFAAESKAEGRYEENKDKEEKDKEKERESEDKEKNKFLSLFMSIISAVSASFTVSSKFEHVSGGTHVSIAVFGALSFAFSSVGLIITIYGWGRLSSIKLAFWMSFSFLTVYSCLGMALASKEAEKDNSVFWAMVTSFLCVIITALIYAIWSVNFEGWVKSIVSNVKGLFPPSVKSKVAHSSSSTSPKKLDSPNRELALNNSCMIDV